MSGLSIDLDKLPGLKQSNKFIERDEELHNDLDNFRAQSIDKAVEPESVKVLMDPEFMNIIESVNPNSYNNTELVKDSLPPLPSDEDDFDYENSSTEDFLVKLKELTIDSIMKNSQCSKEEATVIYLERSKQIQIEQVMENTKFSREDSIKSLEKHNYDAVEAILEFY